MTSRLGAHVILGSVVLFVALVALSISAYPGGTWDDHGTRGYDLVHNLLCDLLSPLALNGKPNAIAASATPLAMLVLDVGLGLSFWFLPAVAFPHRPVLGRWVQGSGLLAALGTALVPFSPSSLQSRLSFHALAVFLGGVPALVAAVLSLVGLASGRRTGLFWLGLSLMGVVVLDLAIYGHYLTIGGPVPLALPLLERPAIFLLLLWLVAVALRMRRRSLDI